MTDQQRHTFLREWMQAYGRLIYSVAFEILHNPQDSEDVFQNTFIKAYFRCSKLQKHENIKAWLCRVATNESLNKLQSSWKKNVTLYGIPKELYCTAEETGRLTQLIKDLPLIYRKCIWLYYYAGYKTHEIADMTGVSHATVRTRLKRARSYLKADIQRSESYEIG